MTTFQFTHEPAVRHRVTAQGDGVQVDAVRVPVRAAGQRSFVVSVDGRSERLHAAVHGDTVFVQLRGRSWRVDRVDATRASGAASAATAGASLAPMPGVVVSLHAAPGQSVRRGDPLLVIESMKLQMTIDATADGVVVELPFAAGQTFQRGAVLVRIESQEAAA